MALPGESEREKREHPNTPSALPAPASGRETLACSPHGCDPTAGVRDGINASCLASSKDKPPTASQDGIATCAARRPPAEDRQGTRMQPRAEPRPAAREREGMGIALPDQSRSTAKSHEAEPVETAQNRSTYGIAKVDGESSPCTGDDCRDPRGLASEVGSEVATVGPSPASSPLMHTSLSQAQPVDDDGASPP